MKPIQLVVISLALFAAAFTIAFTNPTLIDGYDEDSTVSCGIAWGGSASNATESGEADCAQIRSDRFVWSISLLFIGAAALACAIIARTATNGALIAPSPPGLSTNTQASVPLDDGGPRQFSGPTPPNSLMKPPPDL